MFIAGAKGLFSGFVSIVIALNWGLSLPDWLTISHALLVGFIGYGASLVLFIIALRGLGSGRTGAYFSTAPFIGAVIAILFFHESTSLAFWIASALMILGVWLHLNEQHEHLHTHEALSHSHSHIHDEHHQHTHDFQWDGKEPHTHHHIHEIIQHSHVHYPDIHHRHDHPNKPFKEKPRQD
ncbi:EamA-like transporter family protein [Legionella drozanskii LLAP-1]|uniref:EamA-like transporter family protein n=1 Tax=Legionella drozanskii LLAP-1 TaxID=1212489 RepID=A0A0W0SN71_9GAMM|nr:EamA-like transporter family protein [Legionella drozanskii LLAP-1]